ncbi:unnamed protein product [Sphagnum balticum]
MQQEGVRPNSVTFVGVLNAYASVVALEESRCVHQQIVECGWDSDVFVGSSLVDMYAKFGSIEDASRVFKKLPSRDVVTWTAIILGHVQSGQGQKALELFQQMQQEGVRPKSVTIVGVLNACASIVALEEGRCVHQQIIEHGWDSDVFVANSLIDMYAKCGSMEDAWRVFNKMPSRDVVTWTTILGGCAMHRHGKEALKLFEQMCKEGVQPDDITFVCLLSACSHTGLVDEGMHSFALIHGNMEMAERVAKRIIEMEPENAAGYVLLSNIYTAAGSRHLCENVEWQRKGKGAKKQLGRTWIEVNNEVHAFVVEDQDHPQMIESNAEL